MKFTSEDLLKAMGLKVGDRINLGESVFEILNRNKNIICAKCDKEPFMYAISLVELVDRDYTIIQPKPTLTEDEKVILRNLLVDGYRWVARDFQDSELMFFRDNPPKRVKSSTIPYWTNDIPEDTIFCFSHLFQFIKWEDEPYSIEELLKE